MKLLDESIRQRAATVMDRNIVVTAGAGTGKTTLLVDRLIHVLFRQPHPLHIGEIVALTFTNKTASEMKYRLRNRLKAIRDLLRKDGLIGKSVAGHREEDQIRDLRERYGLSHDTMTNLATQALDMLDRAHLGTIHSYAAHLLRLYPVQAGVDPAFQEDDGSRLEALFEKTWTEWLDQELGRNGTHHEIWRPVLQSLDVEDIRQLAWNLTDELVPLVEGREDGTFHDCPQPVIHWLTGLAEEGERLLARYPETFTLENMLKEAVSFLQAVTDDPTRFTNDQGNHRDKTGNRAWLTRSLPPSRKCWTKEDYARAKHLIKMAQQIEAINQIHLSALLGLVVPFVRRCRQAFVDSGYVSFSGLLARARNLVRNHPSIRRDLKRQIGAVLIDEFQDTDPVQYEFLLYLAEKIDQSATHWKSLSLEPGKLFIVGDPKQSIYAFRRADMEAFDAVVNNVVLAGEPTGEDLCLQTNFRSHAELLAPINVCFAGLFPPEAVKGLQPRYDALQAAPVEGLICPDEGVEIRLVSLKDEEADAEAATRAEAEELARWLREEVFGRESVVEQDHAVPVKPRHVAVIFRTLTYAHVYLEAFRRNDIPFITEGEKHFYRRQEIIDCVNILRAAANPDDQVALVGVLRSAVGGLTDREIEALARQHQLDFRLVLQKTERDLPVIYEALYQLHQRLPVLPVEDALETVFADVPVLELAAASLDGEQALVNLFKLRSLVADLIQHAGLTLSGLVGVLSQRIADPPPEGEMPLSEEGQEQHEDGAVQILSIHKAKGLEFPMVIVAGLQRGTDQKGSRVFVQHDWSSDVLGIRVGPLVTMGGLYVSSKLQDRERAEQIRLLYVAMTRAKRRLVLSAGLAANSSRNKESLLTLVLRGMELDLESLFGADQDHFSTSKSVGKGTVRVNVIPGREWVPQAEMRTIGWKDPDQTQHLGSSWDQWMKTSQELADVQILGTPSLFMAEENDEMVRGRSVISTTNPYHSEQKKVDVSRLLGILAHRIVEQYDFSDGSTPLFSLVRQICEEGISEEDKDLADHIRNTLGHMFRTFEDSPIAALLRKVEILGKEVPFTIPWNQGDGLQGEEHTGPLVMEGVIDLIYRWKGEIWVADYKTDKVGDADLPAQAAKYSRQLGIYAKAVAQSFNISSVRQQVIFLRNGQGIEVGGGLE